MSRITKWLAGVLAISTLTIGGVFAAIWLFPEPSTHFAIDMERKASGLEHHELTLSNGERYHYLIGGQGEPLLLLHGFGANKDNFTRIARHLTSHYRVIVPDQMGFGESSKPPLADYRADAQAQRLHEFLQLLPNEKINAIHIGGNSMGGHIALAYAAHYPQQVKSLWLLDAGGVWSAPKAEAFLIEQKTGVFPLLVSSVADYQRVFEMAMSDPPFVPAPMLAVMAQPSIANRALEAVIFKQVNNDPIEERAKTITAPTLIVWGTEDRLLSPKAGDILHGLIPNSQLILMQGIGHLPMLESVKQTADDYLTFRAGIKAT